MCMEESQEYLGILEVLTQVDVLRLKRRRRRFDSEHLASLISRPRRRYHHERRQQWV